MDQDQRAIAPSERAAIEQQKKKEMERRAQLRADAMRQDFTRTFGSAHGKRVLQWIRQRVSHNEVILSAERESGKVDPLLTTFAAMELNLYLNIRKHLSTEILTEVEIDGSIEPSGTIRDSDGAAVERTASRRKRSTVE